MESIKLTENHKEKLLEMCMKLFPEYKYWWITCPDLETSLYHVGFSNKKFLSFYWGGGDIHWFEFCLSYLSKKLAEEYYKQKLYNAYYPHWFAKEIASGINLSPEEEKHCELMHPVDYLYQKYKKLVIWNS